MEIPHTAMSRNVANVPIAQTRQGGVERTRDRLAEGVEDSVGTGRRWREVMGVREVPWRRADDERLSLGGEG
jgi:hypothetical protein